MSTETLEQILNWVKPIEGNVTISDRFVYPVIICKFSTAKIACNILKEMKINAEPALIYLNDSALRGIPVSKIEGWISEIDEPFSEGDEDGFEDEYSSANYKYAIVIREDTYGY